MARAPSRRRATSGEDRPRSLPHGPVVGRVVSSGAPCPSALPGNTDDGVCAAPMAVRVLRARDAAWLHTTGGPRRTGEDQAGCQGRSRPLPACGVLPREDLAQAVPHTLAHAQAGPHSVRHGAAGREPPGRLRASRARRALGLSGAEAIPWGRPVRPHGGRNARTATGTAPGRGRGGHLAREAST